MEDRVLSLLKRSKEWEESMKIVKRDLKKEGKEIDVTMLLVIAILLLLIFLSVW